MVSTIRFKSYLVFELTKTSYTSHWCDRPATFPFHKACFHVLTHAVLGESDITHIDKDAMYSAMDQIYSVSSPTSGIGLDYGGILGMGQFWDCIPGEEVGSTIHREYGTHTVSRHKSGLPCPVPHTTVSISLCHSVAAADWLPVLCLRP
jgi:hypothetical protein